jgi:hypothetical protein
MTHTKDEALKSARETLTFCLPNDLDRVDEIIAALVTPPAAAQPEQEPVSMRMPKAGDKVICLEDESLATVVSLTAGGSRDIVFSDGSRGTYLLHEFAELFGYATPPAAAQRTWVGLTYEQMVDVIEPLYLNRSTAEWSIKVSMDDFRAIEAKLKELNT